MPNWKTLVPLLNTKAKAIKNSLFHSRKDTTLEIRYYYCDAVMDLVKFIREKTKAKELGATHHVLKALFRWVMYQDRARLEVSKDGRRIDIYVDETRQEIEVKTISQMEVYELYKKAIGVIDSSAQNLDSLWIFYFYRVHLDHTNAVPRKKITSLDEEPTCHYLLAFVTIDLVMQDSHSLKQDLIQLVEESLKQVGKKLKIRPELIIPLENLIKVDDLERIIDEKDQVLQNKDQIIQDKDQIIQDKDQIIQRLKDELQQLKDA